MDTEEIAPSRGLTIYKETVTSDPDGNKINIQIMRPDNDEVVPCVYYIHGGGMQSMSCFNGNFQAFGRMIAANGVAVALVDFRNALVPSSVEEVAPFPAGLNDCVSGVQWLATIMIPSKLTQPKSSSPGRVAWATSPSRRECGS